MPTKTKGKAKAKKTETVRPGDVPTSMTPDEYLGLLPAAEGDPDPKAADYLRFRFFERAPEQRARLLADLGLSVEDARTYVINSLWPADGSNPTDIVITEG